MSNAENEKLILRWFEAVNKADVPQLEQLADELFTTDFIEHDPSMPNFEPGPAGVKALIHQIRGENTGIQAAVHDIFSQGDKVAYRFTLTMTNTASGELLNMQFLAISRFLDGKMAEEWQLGVRGKW
jgi:ketosteroid isomerase-like protein